MLSSHWRKSSYSALQDCVEVRHAPDGHVEMRDTKDRDAGALAFSESEFAAFLAGIKAGEFDLPEDRDT